VLRGKAQLREHFGRGLAVFGASVRFQLLDLLTGVNGYTIYYQRENGATVVDTVLVNTAGKGEKVHAHYASPR